MAQDPLAWIYAELAELESQHLRRQLAARQTPQQAVITLGGKSLVNFSSNDYLGLAAELSSEVLVAAIDSWGWGSGASPLVTGRSRLHAELEEQLAVFEGTPAALLFPSGYAANVGAITSLAGKGDVIFSDAKNHASIIDGCRLSGAQIRIYAHADADSLREMLAQASGFRRRLIVTDGLFSMDGDLAPLVELARLAERHAAMLMVDEAHATGVFGPRGRGVSEHLGVEQDVHVRVGTLSKALGSMGGFVAGPRTLVDWLANRARTYVYSTAPPAPLAAASIEALRIVTEQPERRARLLSSAAELRRQLTAMGWNAGRSASQIIPLVVGQADAAMRLHKELYERGLLVPAIRPPSVPPGESLLRLSLCHGHTDQMLSNLLAALDELCGSGK